MEISFAKLALTAALSAMGMLLGSAALVAAEDMIPPATVSPLCTSFDPNKGEFGMVGPLNFAQLEVTCPANQVYFALRNASGSQRPGSHILLLGTCCPVPGDLLSSNHVFATEQCPEGFVVTGSKQIPAPGEQIGFVQNEDRDKQWFLVRTQQLKCTEINRGKYALSPPLNGWNVGWYAHFTTAFADRTSRARIPVALRYGLGRYNHTGFSHNFCAGMPWGSLLVGRAGKYCSETKFSELTYRDGRPVFDYAKCLSVTNPLSREAACFP